MDFQELLEKHSPFIKRNFLPIALGFFGLIFFGYGLIVLLGSARPASNEILFQSGEDANEKTKEHLASKNKSIFVDVEGAVVNPGVYGLNFEARVKDALVAAGGLGQDADRGWVEKNLNLAVRLTDGAKIYIPKIGESIMGNTMGADQININTASAQELDKLPGVGPVTAQKIIDNRPYSTIDELLSKKIINSKAFESIKEKIAVY